MTETSRPKVVVALPAFNEERYIATVVLKARQHADKVIVVDDGSSDQTAEIAALAGAVTIRHTENQGKGAAIQTILREVKRDLPDVLVLIDADYQHDPDEIPDLILPILDGYDFVIGSRKLVKQDIPSYRRVGQRVLLYLTSHLTRKKITDSESGFRAFSRKAIEEMDLTQKGFAVETEMIAIAEEKKLKMTEVPISARYTKDGSTLNPIQHGVTVMAQILGMISERKPLFFFGFAGIIFFVIGLIAGIRTIDIFTTSKVIPSGTMMLAVLFIIIGVFCGFTGIILHIISHRKN